MTSSKLETSPFQIMASSTVFSFCFFCFVVLPQPYQVVAASTESFRSSLTYRRGWSCSSSSLSFLPANKRRNVSTTLSEILVVRGGFQDDEDDDDGYDNEYDDEEEDEDDEYDEDKWQQRRKNPANQKEEYDHSMIDLPPASSSSPSIPRHRRDGTPPPHRRKPIRKTKKPAHWSQRIATKSLQTTGQLAWNAFVKQPGKLAYHVILPKHVDIRETDGLWRLDQQVTERGDHVVASVATIELQARPRLVVLRRHVDGPSDEKDQAKVIKEPYTFTKRKLTGSFQTQFVAPAFLVGDNQVRLYGYRGTWQRKLADRRVIKLVGKIYQVHKQRFGKQRGEYVFGQAVGTFVMRRRIRMVEEEEQEYEDEENDDEDWDEIDDQGWEEDDYEAEEEI
mmetsp:Transcript_5959/g.10314  ORF Transcript_5959/g.10314 Transcript_5959/m.10314 type:complete len:393 (+) Transcript_5959:3-1181(+)